MKFIEKQALLNEFSKATEGGCELSQMDIEAIIDHFDDVNDGRTVIELSPQTKYEGLKRKYIVLKSDTGETVENCFVLRPDIDEAAIAALFAYASATSNAELQADIKLWIRRIVRKGV